MAKTIKDMAIEAYPVIENGVFWQSPMEYEVEIKQKRGAYIKGANAVLEKIEEATQVCFDEELLKVIRELKGE